MLSLYLLRVSGSVKYSQGILMEKSSLGAQCVGVSCLVMSNPLQPHRLYPTRLLCPWDSPGKNTGVGCHFPLQGIFLTQRLNTGLLHCRQIIYHLSYREVPSVS